jgi:predicted nucleic acid-binding protein
LYLLDTNIVSEARKPRPHGALIAWLAAVPTDDLFLAAITIGEIQAGIEITRDQDPAKAAELEAWLIQVVGTQQILSMDGRIFRSWARLMHRQPDHLMEDAMIAATAQVHNLTVATRNVKDFARFAINVVNPFVA